MGSMVVDVLLDLVVDFEISDAPDEEEPTDADGDPEPNDVTPDDGDALEDTKTGGDPTEGQAYTTTIAPDSLTKFMGEIRRFPMLGEKEEYELAHEWVANRNPEAAKRLITSHLRLVAKIAHGYKGYGLPVAELVSEGVLGLMQAVKRYDPEKGVRLSTYAMWWIRASIQEYILRSWSLVKITATGAQKKLFFNLRRLKGELEAYDDKELHPDDVKRIAQSLNVSEAEVLSMNQRLSGGDASLNAPAISGPDGEGTQWQDWLVDGQKNQEETYAKHQEYDVRWKLLKEGLSTLNDRERSIIEARHLEETPKTLDELSRVHNVSMERIRQIEGRAFEKLQLAVKKNAMTIGYSSAS